MPNTALYMYVCVQVWKGRRTVEGVCAGRGVRVRESSPSNLFAVAKVKPGKTKKTILGSCYVSAPGEDRDQEVTIRKEAGYYTKVILSIQRGHISCEIPTFIRVCSLIHTNKWFVKEFQISEIGTSPTCPYPIQDTPGKP